MKEENKEKRGKERNKKDQIVTTFCFFKFQKMAGGFRNEVQKCRQLQVLVSRETSRKGFLKLLTQNQRICRSKSKTRKLE